MKVTCTTVLLVASWPLAFAKTFLRRAQGMEVSTALVPSVLGPPQHQLGQKLMVDLLGRKPSTGVDGGGGNMAVSPLSVVHAMSLVLDGAPWGSRTQANLASGLKLLPPAFTNHKDVNQALAASLGSLKGGEGGPNVTVANSVWVRAGLKARKEYLQDMEGIGASVMELGGPDPVNEWVASATNGKIEHIVDDTDGVEAMLVNAVFFKGLWASPFNPTRTVKAPFYPAGDSTDDNAKTIICDMMRQTAHFKYERVDSPVGSYQVLSMPYGSTTASGPSKIDEDKGKGKVEVEGEGEGSVVFEAVLVLPDPEVPLLRVLAPSEDGDDGAAWSKLLQRARTAPSTEVDVSMPKFKVETDAMQLVDPMRESLGISDVFTPGLADLSRMSEDARGLYVDQVVHKVMVEVDEAGTEAAAATAVSISRSAASLGPPQFKANRPFLFLITQPATGHLLFAAVVADPPAAQ